MKIDKVYKIYRIDFLPPHPVNLVNPVYFQRSFHVAMRQPETMRINHEETKRTKKRPEKTFVLFVSSWLILRRRQS
jgi:hypothetical protein